MERRGKSRISCAPYVLDCCKKITSDWDGGPIEENGKFRVSFISPLENVAVSIIRLNFGLTKYLLRGMIFKIISSSYYIESGTGEAKISTYTLHNV